MSSSSGNQVDGLPLALINKDAGSASCPLFGRACERISCKQNHTVGMKCDAKLVVNHQNADSSYIKASIGAINC